MTGGRNQLSISDAIKRLAGRAKHVLLEGLVTSIQEDGTCTVVVDQLDIEMPGIHLRPPSDGEALVEFVPSVGSLVIVSVSSDGVYYVTGVSVVDSAAITGSKYGSIKSEDLIQQLGHLTDAVTKILQAINHTTPPIASDGGAALNTAMKAAVVGAQVGSLDNLINENLRHGI